MTDHEGWPQVPVRPARDHRALEKVMKAVLIVAAVAGALLLLYMALFIGIFVMAS
ncbi:hypothetical protein [Streptomyces avidinii]|uniref:Uncharacterized protein n=1 Tax=Streptomyces avidinii TaxID=1895 RepID=A0ABS4L6T6_STRAV|nr:hypothetical protein [Streptomyces avidinii]MBP2037836.1 hypothetical protein [Streptomyces avidinii]GGZ08340.1 hypothetical protein GCM10010343_38210 [Streptomyces avidinii]